MMRTVAAVVAAVVVLCGPLQAQETPAPKPTSPREVFRLLGVGDDYFNRFSNGGPIDAPQTDTLLRILFRLRMFPLLDMDRWALDSETLPEAVEHPDKFRGSIFRLRGQVIEVEPHMPSVEAAGRYELTKYYRCRLQLDSPEAMADVYVARQESDTGNGGVENVPAAWRKGARPDAPGGALGVFLKLGRRSDGQNTLVFAARRLAWYPDDLLGRLGMDVGLLDDVKDRSALGAGDNEAFYQMLAAVGRAEPGQLLRQAEADLPYVPGPLRWTDQDGHPRYSVKPLFNEPAQQRGRLVELMGTARRIEEIHIDDPDVAARFGFDHYYQVSLFTDDSYNLVDPNEPPIPYPLTFCIRELPEGMPYGDLPHYGETVRIAGFFFKTWAYHVPKVSDSSLKSNPSTQLQFSPLLIGRGLVWRPAPKAAENTSTNLVIGGLFLVFMLLIWGLAWQTHRHARQWERQAVGGPPRLDSGIGLGPVERRAEGSPDFSRLAEMEGSGSAAQGSEAVEPAPPNPDP